MDILFIIELEIVKLPPTLEEQGLTKTEHVGWDLYTDGYRSVQAFKPEYFPRYYANGQARTAHARQCEINVFELGADAWGAMCDESKALNWSSRVPVIRENVLRFADDMRESIETVNKRAIEAQKLAGERRAAEIEADRAFPFQIGDRVRHLHGLIAYVNAIDPSQNDIHVTDEDHDRYWTKADGWTKVTDEDLEAERDMAVARPWEQEDDGESWARDYDEPPF